MRRPGLPGFHLILSGVGSGDRQGPPGHCRSAETHIHYLQPTFMKGTSLITPSSRETPRKLCLETWFLLVMNLSRHPVLPSMNQTRGHDSLLRQTPQSQRLTGICPTAPLLRNPYSPAMYEVTPPATAFEGKTSFLALESDSSICTPHMPTR
jgi:hypothetical protein